MSTTWLILGMMVASTSWAATLPGKLSTIPCSGEIEKLISKTNSTDYWFRTVDPQVGVMSYRSSTTELAKWVEVQSFPNPYLIIYTPKKSRVYQWDAKTCELIMNTDTKPLGFLENKKASFSDEVLKQFVESEKKSMIYIWSPTMTYSVKEMGVFRKVAKDLDLNFVPVLDLNDSVKEAQKILAQYQPDIKVEKFRSLELYMREGVTHFPSTYIVGNKRISPRIFGVMTEPQLTEQVKKDLIDLEAEGGEAAAAGAGARR